MIILRYHWRVSRSGDVNDDVYCLMFVVYGLLSFLLMMLVMVIVVVVVDDDVVVVRMMTQRNSC